MKYSDIQISDEELRQQFIEHMNQGRYVDAINLLSVAKTQIPERLYTASQFNSLTDEIVKTENLSDPSFKQDKIKLSAEPPEGLKTNEIYFQII